MHITLEGLTVSREAAALMSGRKPTSNTCSRKSWFSIPYTLSRNSTMGALWSGQKLADMSGSVTDPSGDHRSIQKGFTGREKIHIYIAKARVGIQ